jgi:hypothetical protein
VQTNKTTSTTAVDRTDCKEEPFLFPELICRKTVTVDHAGGEISSDGGSVLLGRLDRSYGYLKRFAQCFTDYRDEELIEHPVLDLLRQRIYGLALGYEDLNDHDRLRADPLLAAVCGKEDPLGLERQREQDRGKAMAGKSTLNRLELTTVQASPASRYKKIQADPAAIEDYFIEEFVRSLPRRTKQVVLDVDRTNDPLHGNQEGRFFHGYYRQYCYTPFYIFCGDWPVVAALHTGDSEHQDDVRRLVEKVVAQLRRRFARLQIVLRGDSGYCRDELMSWCEKAHVYYVFGLQRNAVLEAGLRGSLRQAKRRLDEQGTQSQRVYRELRYRAKKWCTRRRRRVVGKAEWTTQGSNPRFVITNLEAEQYPAPELYEQIYCARGDMENRIKEQQLDLYADRTSSGLLRANQLRLWFSTLAYLLVNQLRQVALRGTDMAQATCGTIRLRLFKIGALVRVTARRVWISLSSAYPLASLFGLIARRLRAVPAG